MYHLLSCANVLHCDNPVKVAHEWIENYQLQNGNFDITEVDRELVEHIPDPLAIGAVYQRKSGDLCKHVGHDINRVAYNDVDGIRSRFYDFRCDGF